MQSSLRSVITLTALGLAGALTGCVAAAEQPETREVTEPLQAVTRAHDFDARELAVPVLAAAKAHGLVQMIGEALAEVSLKPDQDTAVRALGAEVEPLQSAVDQAESDILLKLAQQVRTQRIHRSAFEPEIAAYVAARVQMSTPLRSALERLHGILDPAQRDDLADALECNIHRVVVVAMSGERLDKFADGLGLNDEQKQKVRDEFQLIMPSLQEERHLLHQTIEGFRADTFTVEQFMPQSDVAAKAHARAARLIDVTQALLSILDPTQRGKLAARIQAASGVLPPRGPQHLAAVQEELEEVGSAADAVWAGAVRGRRGGAVVVGGSRRFYGRRVTAYPYSAAWGWGW